MCIIKSKAAFDAFAPQLAVRLWLIGYSRHDVALLTVRQLCELYVRDTYPETPTVALSHSQYVLGGNVKPSNTPLIEKHFPICFVVGCPRSRTTLLRCMLDVHDGLWAPGELHLATFESMAERVEHLRTRLLRHMPVPEAAARFGESIDSFADAWRSTTDTESQRCLAASALPSGS